MISIIKWELWQRRWPIFWWSIGISIFMFINLVFYPSFRDQAAQFEQAFSDIPEATAALLSDTGEFISPEGYLSSQVFYLMMPLLIGILAISLGNSLIGREEREKTIELLLSRPISRTRLLIGKSMAGIIVCSIVALISLATTVVMVKVVDMEVPVDNIVLAMLAALLLGISFGVITFTITALGKSARVASIGIATLYALGGYIISSLAKTVTWLEWPSRIFPYDYYKPAEILKDQYNWWNMLFVIGIIVIGAAVSWLAFRRRDIG